MGCSFPGDWIQEFPGTTPTFEKTVEWAAAFDFGKVRKMVGRDPVEPQRSRWKSSGDHRPPLPIGFRQRRAISVRHSKVDSLRLDGVSPYQEVRPHCGLSFSNVPGGHVPPPIQNRATKSLEIIWRSLATATNRLSATTVALPHGDVLFFDCSVQRPQVLAKGVRRIRRALGEVFFKL